jgi:CheY-like chemotaxis protein
MRVRFAPLSMEQRLSYHPQVALRVVLADDSYVVRVGLAALMRETDEIELVGAADSLPALMDAVEQLRPEAVITDIRMPPTNTSEGIVAAREIRERYRTIGLATPVQRRRCRGGVEENHQVRTTTFVPSTATRRASCAPLSIVATAPPVGFMPERWACSGSTTRCRLSRSSCICARRTLRRCVGTDCHDRSANADATDALQNGQLHSFRDWLTSRCRWSPPASMRCDPAPNCVGMAGRFLPTRPLLN